MTNREIEDIVNGIIEKRGIKLIPLPNNRLTVIHPEKGMATGSKEVFDKAMREIAQKYKQ